MSAEPARPKGLVPPRPNLGPEPWGADHPSRDWSQAAWLAVAALLLVAALAARRRRRGKARNSAVVPSTGIDAIADPSSRRGRLVVLSGEVREALVARFGPSWRSKTTEELAQEPALADAFGADEVGRLLRFLLDADRAKFGGDGGPDASPAPEPDDAWILGFLERAGPRPTPRG